MCALEKSYTDGQDHTDASAYHRIINLALNFDTSVGEIEVRTFKDATASGAGKQATANRTYTLSDTGFTDVFGATAQDVVNKNPQESAYVHLKTLTDFSGAIDV